ncbi:MAG: TonB-dependent receptor [Verrucomicrobiota bacterium]|nr:TonB-dependent receptor [Verrucomicrobiota bacterium]
MSYHNYRHFRGTVLRNAITVGLGSQLIAVPVLWAQTAGAAQTMDRVQITGSLIPTADTVGVAPVETVDAERITLTGQQDILAVLRRYSTSFAGSGNAGQTENNGGFGEANVALRNLSTLILLDGRRLASSAFSNGAAVDVNTLPLAMIDRIEILKDGSSTIYGSDAVGGVVNIITKKNWNGFEVGTRYGFATGNGYFNETQAHAVYGYAKDGVRLTTGINYYQSDPLYTKNRQSASLGRQELIDRGVNPPTYVSPSYSGRVDDFLLAGSPFAVGAPGYRPGLVAPPQLTGGPYPTVADYNAAAVAQLGYAPYLNLNTVPAANGLAGANFPLLNTSLLNTISIQGQDRRNAFANFEKDFADGNVTFYTQFLFTQTESIGQLAPPPLIGIGQSGLFIPAASAANPFGVDLGNDGVNAGSSSPRGRNRFSELGNRSYVSETDFFHVVAGFKGKVAEKFTWDVGFNFNRSEQLQTSAAGNGSLLNQALAPDLAFDPTGRTSQLRDANGNRVPVFNFFALPGYNDPRTIDAIRYTGYQAGRSELYSVDPTFGGDLFELPAGPLAFMVGAQYIHESLAINFDPESINGTLLGYSAQLPFSGGTRDRYAGFAEVRVPLASPEQNLPALYRFELTASGRFEQLDTGGVSKDATVPKVGFRWQPLDDQVTVRGAYSQGFVVPGLYSLFGPAVQSFPTISVGGAMGQQQVTYISNSALPPADSESFTGGLVITPKAIKNLTLSAEYYYINQDNIGYYPDQTAIVADINALGNASRWAKGYTDSGGNPLTTGAANQVTASNFGNLDVPLLPGSSQRTYGIDFTANYKVPTDSLGEFNLFANANYLLGYKQNQGPGTPFLSFAGQYTDSQVTGISNGAMPDYLVTTGTTWDYQNFQYSIVGRYVPGVADQGYLFTGDTVHGFTANDLVWNVPDYYTVDMRLAYNFKSANGGAWYDGTSIAIGVNNITDEKPPLIASSSEDNTDKSTYDLLGRFVYVQASKKF